MILSQDRTTYYVLSNNRISPIETNSFMWIEVIDGHTYCMLPSIQPHSGRIAYYTREPSFVREFSYNFYIGELTIVTMKKKQDELQIINRPVFEDHEDWSKFIRDNEKLF